MSWNLQFTCFLYLWNVFYVLSTIKSCNFHPEWRKFNLKSEDAISRFVTLLSITCISYGITWFVTHSRFVTPHVFCEIFSRHQDGTEYYNILSHAPIAFQDCIKKIIGPNQLLGALQSGQVSQTVECHKPWTHPIYFLLRSNKVWSCNQSFIDSKAFRKWLNVTIYLMKLPNRTCLV